MSGPAIVQLQQLRQLRERRAQNHLTLQIQRCRAAQAAVEQAQQQVDVALEQLRQEATALQKLLGEGAVAVGTYQTALEMLDVFDQYRARLLEQLHSAEQHCAEQEQHKLTLQRALLVRQQQCEALTPLLQAHQRQVWRDNENSEEELYDERAALRARIPS